MMTYNINLLVVNDKKSNVSIHFLLVKHVFNECNNLAGLFIVYLLLLQRCLAAKNYVINMQNLDLSHLARDDQSRMNNIYNVMGIYFHLRLTLGSGLQVHSPKCLSKGDLSHK